MRSPLEIRNDAMDCLRLAEETTVPRHKSLFLLMAQAWNMLAQQAETIGAPADGEAEAFAEPEPTTH
jgi:hypothetical protein